MMPLSVVYMPDCPSSGAGIDTTFLYKSRMLTDPALVLIIYAVHLRT